MGSALGSDLRNAHFGARLEGKTKPKAKGKNESKETKSDPLGDDDVSWPLEGPYTVKPACGIDRTRIENLKKVIGCVNVGETRPVEEICGEFDVIRMVTLRSHGESGSAAALELEPTEHCYIMSDDLPANFALRIIDRTSIHIQ